MLENGIKLAREVQLQQETLTPLIAICSKAVRRHEVIAMATRANVEAHAFDLSQLNPIEDLFETSSDEALIAASPGWRRDLSMKRNLGLILARLLGWTRIMFLDDDIYGITVADVNALASALDDHSVSALIPLWYPDNSVACHANRDSGGGQGVFASANGMGVRCDRDDLGFFPNIYNEDWFFFCAEAANRKIAKVGISRQIEYDPYADPGRAAREEFGDLLAEGLYAGLEVDMDIQDIDAGYWTEFISKRQDFHGRVAEALRRVDDRELGVKAGRSIQAAQNQLAEITAALCDKFVGAWQADLAEWRRYYVNDLPLQNSIMNAIEWLKLGLPASRLAAGN